MKSLRSREHRALCAAIKEGRQAQGMTQRDLAARLKRPHSFIAKIEVGERRVDVVEFIAIARALRVDPAKLIARIAG